MQKVQNFNRLFFLIGLILMVFITEAIFGQGRQMRIEGEIFQLPELGALVAAQGDTIRFIMVQGPEARPKGYAEIDAKEKDEVLMMNGKRVKSTETLKTMYEELAVGEEVKLGVRRDEQMFILAFPKIDPKNAPKMMVRTMAADGGDGSGEVFPIAELRIMLVADVDGLKVQSLPIDVDGKIDGLDVKEGDFVTSLNGKKVSTVKGFEGLYTGISVGEVVKMEVQRDGKTVASSFKKPEPMGKVMIKRGGS